MEAELGLGLMKDCVSQGGLMGMMVVVLVVPVAAERWAEGRIGTTKTKAPF